MSVCVCFSVCVGVCLCIHATLLLPRCHKGKLPKESNNRAQVESGIRNVFFSGVFTLMFIHISDTVTVSAAGSHGSNIKTGNAGHICPTETRDPVYEGHLVKQQHKTAI